MPRRKPNDPPIELCGVARRRENQDGDRSVIGRPCRHTAGWGTDHVGSGPCKLHGGNLPTVKAKAKSVLADMALRRELTSFGVPLPNVTPEAALLHMVREAAGNVAYLGARVAELSERDADEVEVGRIGPRVLEEGAVRPRGQGLFGAKIGLDKDGGEHVIGEDTRAAVALYGEWSDRLVKYSAAAISAGIAKAQVALAQSQGQTIVVVINRVLAQVGLDEAKQVVARALIAEEFRLLEAGPSTKTVSVESGQ